MLTRTCRRRSALDHAGTGSRPRRAAHRAAPVLAVAAALASASLTAAPGHAATSVQRSPVVAFQPAGTVGGGVLTPDTTFPPRSAGAATLKRGSDWVQVDLQTSGLPAGAYTLWWVVFDAPSQCSAPGCGEDDLLNPDAKTSVFWATGGVVGRSGVATFHDRYRVGEDLGEPGQQHILGGGLEDPKTAEVHNVVKYHGLPSSDPATLREQTHTLLGSCDQGANSHDHGDPFGVQCPDFQAVGFPAP